MTSRGPILVSGATGLVGAALCRTLAASGTDVRALTRSPQRESAISALPGVSPTGWDGRTPPGSDVEACDAFVHLAGEPIFRAGPVSRTHLDRVWSSRIDSTHAIVAAFEACAEEARPRCFVCASAVGYYADSGDDELTEESAAGQSFTSRLCIAWEDAARRATSLGIRVVSLRIGIVFARSGGPLPLMSRPFRLGLGGRLGSGQQWTPWIELDDLVALIVHSLGGDLAGPVNAVSPTPVRNIDLTRALGATLRRPTLLPVPAFAIKLALRTLASELLASKRVLPRAALASGFRFDCATLDAALRKHLA